MPTYIKGEKVANATSYELHEKVGGSYNKLAEKNEINFEVSALGLAVGTHTFAVKAKAEGYADSEYSNALVYTVEANLNPVIDEIFNNMAWTIGKTPGAEQPGLYVTDARYVCMDVPYNTNGETISINNPNTNLYQCNVNICNADGSFNRYDVNQLSSATWTMSGNIRLCMKFKDNRNMTEELWQTMKAEIIAAN